MRDGKKREKRLFQIEDRYGDINAKFPNMTYDDLIILIPNAWNYEASVYEILEDGSRKTLFNPPYFEEDEEIPVEFGYDIIELDQRYIRHIKTNSIWILEWQLEELSNYLIRHGLKDEYRIGIAQKYTLL